MERIDALVVGAGQAGLALSHHVTRLGLDHVVVDRGRVGERWHTRRPSLRLLTPNWMTRLPGWSYRGPDPDGYMGAPDVADHLGGYATSFGAPVRSGTTVHRVEPRGSGYAVRTDHGTWDAATVVVATGHCDRPHVPALAAGLAPGVDQVTADRYRDPDGLPAGGVLVVGASASGVQVAAELAHAGRRVLLAVGTHTRLPRRYRGRDVMWWLDAMGVLARPLAGGHGRGPARPEPSLQLVGHAHRAVDLAALQRAGVELTGRLVGVDGHRVTFADDLGSTVADAGRRMSAVLDRVDAHVVTAGIDAPAPDRPSPVPVPATPDRIDLAVEGIRTVVWATGYRREYPWLRVPVLDGSGEIAHRRGVTGAPGCYVLGLQRQATRSSSFIDGVGRDAAEVAAHLANHLGARPGRHWAPAPRRAG